MNESGVLLNLVDFFEFVFKNRGKLFIGEFIIVYSVCLGNFNCQKISSGSLFGRFHRKRKIFFWKDKMF